LEGFIESKNSKTSLTTQICITNSEYLVSDSINTNIRIITMIMFGPSYQWKIEVENMYQNLLRRDVSRLVHLEIRFDAFVLLLWKWTDKGKYLNVCIFQGDFFYKFDS